MTGIVYPLEILDTWDEDDGTIVQNVAELAEHVVGRRIMSYDQERQAIVLDGGHAVRLVNTDDCCAYTELESFLLNVERVNHIITGIGTTGRYTKWHIFADMGDVLELTVGWSCGNPFYYGYGFEIVVEDGTE